MVLEYVRVAQRHLPNGSVALAVSGVLPPSGRHSAAGFSLRVELCFPRCETHSVQQRLDASSDPRGGSEAVAAAEGGGVAAAGEGLLVTDRSLQVGPECNGT